MSNFGMRPNEAFHPAEVIAEEMQARGWNSAEVARRMPGDFARNVLTLDIYLIVRKRNCRLGDLANGLAAAFGVSPEFFRNLEDAYLAATGGARE